MREIRKIIREILSEIVSTEVERFKGGAPDEQKNQSGYGYLGNQSDAPKQKPTNDKHVFFNTVTSTNDSSEGGTSSSKENNIEEVKEFPISDPPMYGDYDYIKRNGVILTMTPEKYLSLVKKLDIDEESKENIEELKSMMESGESIDPPTLYLDGKQVLDHDGRHRAYASIELGLKKIPVLLIDVNGKVPQEEDLKKQI